MYLLLGDPRDSLCEAVHASLVVGGYEARIVANPLAEPLRFAWRLGTLTSTSLLTWEDGTRVLDTEITGVLVRSPGGIVADGWDPDDLAYIQTETHAALLAWIWSLDCPVINRYPAALWHRPDMPLLFWQPKLAQSGLRALHSLVSNVEREARAFGSVPGEETVYAPLTAEARYRLASDDHWSELAAMLCFGPVHLMQVSMAPHSACVVGPQVVWEGTPPADSDRLEPALTRFAALAGLIFVEITIASTADGIRIAAVDPYPRIEHFGCFARNEIVAGLVRQLTGEFGSRQIRTHDPTARRPAK